MTIEEFVTLDPYKIRRSDELMRLFVEFYEAAFSLKPNCAGCVFNKGFNRLKRYALGSKKNLTMESNDKRTFVLKPNYRGKILTYKENGVVYRKYGHAMTDDFALKLIEHGKEDVFSKLPEQEEADEPKTGYGSMDWKTEILPLYNEVKERTGEKAESRKKEDIINFLKEHEG